MKRTFSIPDSISLEVGDLNVDLHNSFRVIGLAFNKQHHDLVVRFGKERGEWVSPTNPTELILIFEGVTVFDHSFTDLEKVPEDLDEIGFKNPGDENYDWLLSEGQSLPSDHLVMRFTTDDYIRVFADTAKLEVII